MSRRFSPPFSFLLGCTCSCVYCERLYFLLFSYSRVYFLVRTPLVFVRRVPRILTESDEGVGKFLCPHHCPDGFFLAKESVPLTFFFRRYRLSRHSRNSNMPHSTRRRRVGDIHLCFFVGVTTTGAFKWNSFSVLLVVFFPFGRGQKSFPEARRPKRKSKTRL